MCIEKYEGPDPQCGETQVSPLGLHKPIAHLGLGIRQDFIVVDNICGDPNFEDGGSPFYMNRIFAAADPVLCDTFGAQVMGREPEEVPYLSLAEALGVGSTDLSRAHIRALNEPETLPVLPDTNRVMRVADKAEEVDSWQRLLCLSHSGAGHAGPGGAAGQTHRQGVHRPGLPGTDRDAGRGQLHLRLRPSPGRVPAGRDGDLSIPEKIYRYQGRKVQIHLNLFING